MKETTRRALPILVVAILASVLLAPQVAMAQPTIVLEPNSGPVGTTVTVNGAGFEGTGTVSIFLEVSGGQLLASADIMRDGTIQTEFVIPDLAPDEYLIVACLYDKDTRQCRGEPRAKLTVEPTPTTTTTSSPATTTTSPGATDDSTTTSLVGVLATTTSSLALSATTTIGVDPPAPMGPTGVAFTTTSTSLDLPGGLADQNVTHFPDIEVTAVEVTQGIQDLQNRMPLIAGKHTVARVYVAADKEDPVGGGLIGATPEETIGPEGWEPVDGLLYLQRGGEEMFLYPSNGPITAYRRGSDRLEEDETLNFDIPDEWTEGEVNMSAFVWSFLPETVVTSEDDAGNNYAIGTVVFQDANPPMVIWVRLDPVSSSVLSPEAYANAMEAATKSYTTYHPVAVPSFWPMLPALGPGPIVGGEEPSEVWDFVNNRSEPINRMKWIYYEWGLADLTRIHGLISSGVPSAGTSGLTAANSLVAWSKPTETTPAHEGAHMYWIKHAPCQDADDDGLPDEVDGGGWGWIDQTYPAGLPSCSIAPEGEAGYYGTSITDTGLDIYSNDQALANTRYPFMGYQGDKWVDAYHYCLLMEFYEVGCNPESIGLTPKVKPGAPVNCGPSPGDGIIIDLCLWDGAPNFDQQLGPIGSLQLVLADKPPQAWVVVDVDVGESILGHAVMLEPSQQLETDFDFIMEQAKTGDLGNHAMLRVTDAEGHILAQVPVSNQLLGHSETDGTTQTVELIPWFDDAASLDLLIDGEVADAKTPSREPTVAIDPIDPDVREFEVSWTGFDPDGDGLLYSIHWSADGGATWRVLDTGLPQATADITDELALPGGDVLIKVSASDGLSTGSAVTGPFTVPEGEPSGIVIAPDSVPQHSPERMTFHAYDPEDGLIRTGAWSSDIDGPLGEGHTMWTRFLSVGTHQIDVVVSDSSGNEVTLSTEVEVVPGDLQEPRLEGAVPDAETLARLGPDDLDLFELSAGTNEESGVPESSLPLVVPIVVATVLMVLGVGLVLRRNRG